MTSKSDPLELAGLEPANIAKAIDEKKSGKAKVPTELEQKKEARLAQKEARMSAPSLPTGTGPVHSVAPPPEVLDKSVLLDRLMAYRERFPHLKKRNTVTVKSQADDILDELHYCEVQLRITEFVAVRFCITRPSVSYVCTSTPPLVFCP